jgi:hypothetical protein
MRKFLFSDQILPVDYLLSVRTNIQAGKPVSGGDLLRMIEQCMRRPLPESARSVVRLFADASSALPEQETGLAPKILHKTLLSAEELERSAQCLS